jgi:glycosyltransferase involved in cell wall biosynthesis
MKIHIVSNPLNINSGFSIVAKNVALGLKKLGYEVTMSGQQQSYNPEVYYGVESYPVLGTPKDEIGQLISNVLDVKPDLLFNIFQSDSGNFREHAMVFDHVNKMLGSGIKSIWYTPIESQGLSYVGNRDLKSYAECGGHIVSQCKWGKSEMEKEGVSVEKCIYHGVDEKIFKPLTDKECKEIGGKEKVLVLNYINYGSIGKSGNGKSGNGKSGNKNDKEVEKIVDYRWLEENILASELSNRYRNKFVFLVVAKNIGVRKRIERAMKAYAMMVISGSRQNRDQCHLHIHSYPLAADGVNLLDIAKRLGIEQDITFSYGKWKAGWSDEAMSVLYNSCDCHLSASSGEGYGISTNESMACGIPTVGPRNTSFIELIEEKFVNENKEIGPRGVLVCGEEQLIIDGSFRFLVNQVELSDAMKKIYKLYNNGNEYDEYRDNCLEFSKLVTWDRIVGEWDRLIKDKNVGGG